MKEFELKDFRIESKDKDHLEVYYKDSKISKNVSKGNDALYVKLSGVGEGLGVKLVHPGRKSPDSFAYESNTDMCDQIKYIQNKELEIFPKIYDVFHDEVFWLYVFDYPNVILKKPSTRVINVPSARHAISLAGRSTNDDVRFFSNRDYFIPDFFLSDVRVHFKYLIDNVFFQVKPNTFYFKNRKYF